MQLLDAHHSEKVPASGAPTPARIFELLIFGHAKAEALKVAIDLEIFTAIAEGCTTAEALAKRCEASPRGIRTLCDFLVVNEFLTKANGHYALTRDTGAFLDKRAPTYFGSVAAFLASRNSAERYASLATCVRTGAPLTDATDDTERWVSFAQSMVPIAAPSAANVATLLDAESVGPIRVLDVAAGHGEFGLAFARRNPNAHVVALDFADVLAVARRRAAAEGFADRYETIAGSAFDVDLKGPYDVILVPNFVHHFEPEMVERFLKKAHAALKPGGRLVIVEFVVDEDRVSPPVPAMFSMTMLVNTHGDAYTFADLSALLHATGFAQTRRYPSPPTPQTIVLARRP
jgi:SAM-dependent methyltransferase